MHLCPCYHALHNYIEIRDHAPPCLSIGPKNETGSIGPKNTATKKRVVVFSLFFDVIIGGLGVLIIPKWLINVS